MSDKTQCVSATGRRKRASARVTLTPGNGKVKINGRNFKSHFQSEATCGFIRQPLTVTDMDGKFDITVNVKGGGVMGQAGATRHGIARALMQNDPSLRGILKDCGMLTRDARVKERKKPGQPGARKRFQFSKR